MLALSKCEENFEHRRERSSDQFDHQNLVTATQHSSTASTASKTLPARMLSW
jgi:hypothetical protein